MGTLRTQLPSLRLLAITATSGWGKTTAARALFEDRDPVWLTLGPEDVDARRLAVRITAGFGRQEPELPSTVDPVALASGIARATDEHRRPLVLDDVHLAGEPVWPLLRALAADPVRRTPLVVLGQHDLGIVDERRRVQREVAEIGAPALALDLDAVDRLVAAELAPDRVLAARLVATTGGWPALITVLIDALRTIPASLRSAQVEPQLTPERAIARYLDRVVLAEEDDHARTAIALMALTPELPANRLAPLLQLDRPETTRLLDTLVHRGLLLRDPDGRGSPRLAPAVERIVLERPPQTTDGRELTDRLVDQLIADGAITAALQVLGRLDRPRRAAELLHDHGHGLLRGGHLSLVLDTVSNLPQEARSSTIESMRAEALAFRGDWAEALRAFQASGYGPHEPLPAVAALRLGLIHYVRGDLDAAQQAYQRLRDDAPEDADLAALYSWRTTVHWLRGEQQPTRRCAEASMRIATQLGDDRAIAYAHTAMALVAVDDHDRHANAVHYELAADAARRAGDRLQLTRLLANMGSAAGEEGRYTEAIAITEEAIDLAEEQGFRAILGVARCNRAAYLLRTGAVDEAIADAERAREVFSEIGSRTIAYAHHLLGTARTERGDTVLAAQAYDRALSSAGTAGDQQALIPSYLGIARAVALTDLERARDASLRALELDDGGLASGEVHSTAAWVALAAGDRDRALEHADQAIDMGRRHSNPADVAEGTTLLALLADDPRPGLEQARTLWEDLQAPIWVARVELAMARRSDDARDRSRIPWLERRLVNLGCVLERGSAPHVLSIGGGQRGRVVIRALGSFSVEVRGRTIPSSEWGSRKARELVKVLAARVGWRATREELGHLLWPDEPYDRISNRLSVALSVTRSILNGDGDEQDVLLSEGSSIALDPALVEVDVTTFARLAEDGLRATRDAQHEDAVALLLTAEERYGGDLLEDEPELAWAEDRRAELRATYLAATRMLARLVAHDDPDLAIRLLLRLLDRDGYDEPAHLNLCLALLRAGRHGEARRRYRLYHDRMQELELPAVPFDQLQQEAADAPGARSGAAGAAG